jgi:DNA-binding MarR family transcriptional regulator
METRKPRSNSRDFSRNLGFLVHDVARLMRRVFDRRVKHLGLTRSQWFVLAHLYRTDGQTQQHLADELDMERAPLSKLLDRLEAGGWIERRADPGDRRANRVYITEKIDPLMNEMVSQGEILTGNILSGIDARTREQFLTVLAQVKSNLVAMEQEKS